MHNPRQLHERYSNFTIFIFQKKKIRGNQNGNESKVENKLKKSMNDEGNSERGILYNVHE